MISPEAKACNRVGAPRRGARSKDRATLIREAVAAGSPPEGLSREEIGASAARQHSRDCLAYARSVFDDRVAAHAEQLADALISAALGGDSAALLTLYRSASPPARYDGARVQLNIGPISTPEDIDAARRGLAGAVFQGKVTVEDAAHLSTMLDKLSAGIEREARGQLLAEMRRGLAATARGGVAVRVSTLAQRAELLLNGGAAEPEPVVIDAEPGEDADAWRSLL